ncbi:RsmB/NOP family class I SAM-dependent RNA methyltransferase [Camelliibacillus cellulosilyticus]|uniref:RsmB/NOP family class I SAM-dependent RNA methyltransferase n=1 Tax=Camelliibacillus cellulosilyticus TaxID=2174486 RepID=A0ABV9GRN6_9BACL
MQLPEKFTERMQKMLGSEAEAFFQTYDQPKTVGLRVNTLKISVEDFLKRAPFQLEPVAFCSTGFYVDPKDEPGKHPYHRAGLYYMQEPSAMVVAEVLDPKPGEKVLDLCAAPGGKTTRIAAKMENAGVLIASDIHPKRVKVLSENIERIGARNTIVINETPERLAERFHHYFDRILVDAPCSGEGMFRKDPEAMIYWSPEHVIQCAALQRNILDHAYTMLREGGTLVYATCTFSTEENEKQIAAFLERHPDMTIVPIQKPQGVEDGVPAWTTANLAVARGAARLWPHHIKGEGHFVVRLEKRGSNQTQNGYGQNEWVSKQALKDYREFEKRYLNRRFEQPFLLLRDNLFALPDGTPNLGGLKLVRPGLHLGVLKKGRFEPNHALALAIKAHDAKHAISLDWNSDEWKKYLRGETLQTGGNRGWSLVTFESFPIGWGKEVQDTLKNFYPKGLRIPGI